MRRGALGAALVLAVSLTACTAEEPMPVPSSPSPSPSFHSGYVEPEATEIAPLRGIEVPAGSLEHPSIAAKIDNHWAAKPQEGLETTDIVYEELVEGGITRYVAIWHSTIPELLGPVRSIRPMDPDIISPHRGIVAYSGGQWKFVVLMQATPVYNAIHGQSDTAKTFYRAKGRPGPHDVLVKAQEVVAQHLDLAPPPQQFAYAFDASGSTAAKEGELASQLSFRFSSLYWGTWTWDEDRGVYLRTQHDKVDTDAQGDQLSASNVLVLNVQITHATGVPKTELVGSGEATVFSGGSVVKATWTKSSQNAALRLVDGNGITIRLAPGNTWIELLPHTGSMSVQ